MTVASHLREIFGDAVRVESVSHAPVDAPTHRIAAGPREEWTLALSLANAFVRALPKAAPEDTNTLGPPRRGARFECSAKVKDGDVYRWLCDPVRRVDDAKIEIAEKIVTEDGKPILVVWTQGIRWEEL